MSYKALCHNPDPQLLKAGKLKWVGCVDGASRSHASSRSWRTQGRDYHFDLITFYLGNSIQVIVIGAACSMTHGGQGLVRKGMIRV
jgi:hypothetical protein